MQDCFRERKLPDRINETLISPIPNPETIAQFRPISLCNTSYLFVTKILVNRIRPFPDGFNSPFQSSFVPGGMW